MASGRQRFAARTKTAPAVASLVALAYMLIAWVPALPPRALAIPSPHCDDAVIPFHEVFGLDRTVIVARVVSVNGITDRKGQFTETLVCLQSFTPEVKVDERLVLAGYLRPVLEGNVVLITLGTKTADQYTEFGQCELAEPWAQQPEVAACEFMHRDFSKLTAAEFTAAFLKAYGALKPGNVYVDGRAYLLFFLAYPHSIGWGTPGFDTTDRKASGVPCNYADPALKNLVMQVFQHERHAAHPALRPVDRLLARGLLLPADANGEVTTEEKQRYDRFAEGLFASALIELTMRLPGPEPLAALTAEIDRNPDILAWIAQPYLDQAPRTAAERTAMLQYVQRCLVRDLGDAAGDNKYRMDRACLLLVCADYTAASPQIEQAVTAGWVDGSGQLGAMLLRWNAERFWPVLEPVFLRTTDLSQLGNTMVELNYDAWVEEQLIAAAAKPLPPCLRLYLSQVPYPRRRPILRRALDRNNPHLIELLPDGMLDEAPFLTFVVARAEGSNWKDKPALELLSYFCRSNINTQAAFETQYWAALCKAPVDVAVADQVTQAMARASAAAEVTRQQGVAEIRALGVPALSALARIEKQTHVLVERKIAQDLLRTLPKCWPKGDLR